MLIPQELQLSLAESSNGNNPMFCNMNMVYFSLFAVLLV